MRVVGVVTTSRADYTYLLPLLQAISGDSELRLHLLVSGMHLSHEFGMTCSHIEAAGFPIAEKIETLLGSDTPQAIAKSIGLGVLGFAQSFSRFVPDILLVLGDRFEMYAAALAALPFKLPVAHIGGGDVTEGAIDEAFRHGITKLSHLHFVATAEQATRVRRMGEESWRVLVTGEPSLDVIRSTPRVNPDDTYSLLNLSRKQPFLLVTFHPVTLEYENTPRQIKELLMALDEIGLPVLFTSPNADTSGRTITEAINAYVATHAESQLTLNLGPAAYFAAMASAAAMVGNSSSGIIEAASFELPVVNIGIRQRGRLHGENVINCGGVRNEIALAIRRALTPGFRASLLGRANPYGDGAATPRILSRLKSVPLDDTLIRKRFDDGAGTECETPSNPNLLPA